jgi:hypothetical protein
MIWHMGLQTGSIAIDPETIGNLLKNGNLRVPPSQRSYRWKDEHVEDLYRDIRGSIDNNEDEYFLGSIVGIKSAGKTYIYDGQQRLATTMILVAAIRDHFLATGDEESARLTEEESLISTHRRTHDRTIHFLLNTEDSPYFENRVLLRPKDAVRKALKGQILTHDSHKRINSAATAARAFIKSLVEHLSSSDVNKKLHTWLDFIQNALRVIWVQVADERTAFTIFETMNDRGLRLSAADLLKNYLYAIADDRRDEVIQKWQSMTGVLETIDGEEENVVEYVRCFWVTGHGHTRTKQLYDKIKEKTSNKAKALALASNLQVAVQDYAAVILSSHERLADRGENVRTKIANLRELGVTQLRPLLLAAFRNFSKVEFEKLLDACISWSVRALISGVPSGTIERPYATNAFAITEGKFKKAAQVKAEMASIIPNDARFKAAVASANVSNGRLARYYLRALQRCKDGEPEPQYIPNPGAEVTLEHILPQNPGADWNHFTPEEQKAYLNRLGNQVLLPATVNSELGNTSYTLKKPALTAKKNMSLTKEAGKCASWGKDEINQRQNGLAELAVKTWPLR